MRLAVLLGTVVALGSPVVAAPQARDSSQLASAVAQIRTLREAKYLSGFALAKGPYFSLIETCVANGTKRDFVAMLGDRNPLIRVTGAICLAHVVDREEFLHVTARLADDASMVILTVGCVEGERLQVSEVLTMLAEGRFLLRGGGRWGPTAVSMAPPN